MRQRWLGSLALSLGVLVMGRGALFGADTPAPVIQPYPPVEVSPRSQAEPGNAEKKSVSQGSEDAQPAPAASLDRPIPLREEHPAVDAKIQPTGLFSNRGDDSFAFGPAGGFPAARPMPSGPGNTSGLPMPTPVPTASPTPDVPYTWRQPPASAPASQNIASSPLVPLPNASSGTGFGVDPPPPQGSIVSPGAAPMPGVVTGPMGAPLDGGGIVGDDCCMPGCCTPGCCDGCGLWNRCRGNGCCFGDRWYGSAEYLLWFIRGQSLPPLLTTGPINAPIPGALGMPGTNVLLGGNSFNNNPYSGMRLRGGYWFGDCHGLGLDLGGFFLGGGNNSFTASSVGVPFLARPFTNALTGAQDIEAVAAPGGLAGTFTALHSFILYGAEANLRRNLLCGCNWFIDGFAGWRLLGLNESLSMTERLAVVSSANPSLPAGSTFQVNDRFGTSNLFNGGQIGLIGEYRVGRWSVNVRDSVGIGGTMQFANVNGSTTTGGIGILPVTSPGGLLAQTSNMGPHTRGMVSFVEEVGVNVGYQFTNHIRGFIGYNFLLWTSVLRPAQQIDPVVNPNLIPPPVSGGPNRPAFSFNGSDFWVQGINFGLDIRW